MRGMTDEEWVDFHNFVHCKYLLCAGGLGLAGNGQCSFAGEWSRADCPKFITYRNFEKWQKKKKK